jgi:hypothetical protein
VLERTMTTVVKGREQLQAVVEPMARDLGGDDDDEKPLPEAAYDSDDRAVFDQDDL